MNSCDVEQYLEKLYNVSSVDVRIEIEKGKYIKNPRRGNSLSPPMPDQKFAYVQLKDVKFEYPKLLDNKAATKFEEEMKTIEKMQNQKRNKDAHRLDIGAWFAWSYFFFVFMNVFFCDFNKEFKENEYHLIILQLQNN